MEVYSSTARLVSIVGRNFKTVDKEGTLNFGFTLKSILLLLILQCVRRLEYVVFRVPIYKELANVL